MKIVDYLLIGAIVLAVIWAARVCIRNRRQGKTCSGDCSRCNHSCGR